MGWNLRWAVAGLVTTTALAVPVWLGGAVVLPPLLEDPAIRWPLASALGTALAALAASWGYGFATRGQRATPGQAPSSPSVQATAERAVAIGGSNQGPVSTGDTHVPAQSQAVTPAAPHHPAVPPADAVTASGSRSIAIGGNNSGPLSTGDKSDSPRP
ncbi:hypothetical protein [Streptomyces sp. NPDC056549]|uniref:hypothetical protein n=1 Tax=Streptomyces sp. NPDC056549 TaxID=3345864 RepID=UPI0036854F91